MDLARKTVSFLAAVSFVVLLVLGAPDSVFAQKGTGIESESKTLVTTGAETTAVPATTQRAVTSNRPSESVKITDNGMGSVEGTGFNYTGLFVALVIAAAVVLLVVLLVPKTHQKQERN